MYSIISIVAKFDHSSGYFHVFQFQYYFDHSHAQPFHQILSCFSAIMMQNASLICRMSTLKVRPHWALDAHQICIQSTLIASALRMRKTKPSSWLCASAAFISFVSQSLAMLSHYGNSYYATCDEGCGQLHSIPIHFQCTSRCELAQCTFNPVWFFSVAVWMRSMRSECEFDVHLMLSVDEPLV